jgi:hypothetical protein
MDESSINSRTIYFYDESDRISRVVTEDQDRMQHDFESYSYDAAGRKTKLQFRPKLDPNVGFYFGIEGTETWYGADDAVVLKTEYDGHGQPAEAFLCDANHVVVRRVTLAWDSNGRLLSEEMHSGERPPFPGLENALNDLPPEARAAAAAMLASSVAPSGLMSSTAYTYDEKGRRVERCARVGGISKDRTSYRYDEHDNPIEETHEKTSHDLNVDETGNLRPANEKSLRHKVRFEYKYDDRGNWTERIVSVCYESNPDFQRSNIERREITYYPESESARDRE